MCNATAIQLIAQAGGSILSGVEAQNNLTAQRSAALVNETRSRGAAADAVYRGAQDESTVLQKAGALRSQQATAMASSGVAMGSNSYLKILAGADAVANHEAALTRANAAREAMGYQREADAFRDEAAQLNRDRNWAMASSLIGGASQTVGSGMAALGNKYKKS